jgi:hypothetical protein
MISNCDSLGCLVFAIWGFYVIFLSVLILLHIVYTKCVIRGSICKAVGVFIEWRMFSYVFLWLKSFSNYYIKRQVISTNLPFRYHTNTPTKRYLYVKLCLHFKKRFIRTEN